jgi:hypothetical protein
VAVRKYVIDAIKPLLPKSWRFIEQQQNLDTIDQVTVILILQDIAPAPAAPRGALLARYTLTLIEPKVDPARAEKALDDLILELVQALAGVPNLVWTTATRALFGENQAYDITLEVTTKIGA